VASSSPASGDVIADIQLAGLNFIENDMRNKREFRGALRFDEKTADCPSFDLRTKEQILSPLVNRTNIGSANKIDTDKFATEILTNQKDAQLKQS
jgi:hypothetical protein